jgi:hypothetical protein
MWQYLFSKHDKIFPVCILSIIHVYHIGGKMLPAIYSSNSDTDLWYVMYDVALIMNVFFPLFIGFWWWQMSSFEYLKQCHEYFCYFYSPHSHQEMKSDEQQWIVEAAAATGKEKNHNHSGKLKCVVLRHNNLISPVTCSSIKKVVDYISISYSHNIFYTKLTTCYF